MVGFMFVRRTVVLLPLPIRKRKGVTTTATKGVQVFDEVQLDTLWAKYLSIEADRSQQIEE